MSFLGNTTTSHLAFAKSNSEIEPIMSKFSEIRNNINNRSFLRRETENVRGNANLWIVYFPHLVKDT